MVKAVSGFGAFGVGEEHVWIDVKCKKEKSKK